MKNDVKLLMLAILASSGAAQGLTQSAELIRADSVSLTKESLMRRIYPEIAPDYENYADWPYANAADIPYENYGDPN